MAVYPPHPEEGASKCAFPRRKHRAAPVSKDGAAPWFETPRTRLQNPGRSKIAAPHHEGREDLRVRQIDRNPLLVTRAKEACAPLARLTLLRKAKEGEKQYGYGSSV